MVCCTVQCVHGVLLIFKNSFECFSTSFNSSFTLFQTEETPLSDDVLLDDDVRNDDEGFSELRALRNTLQQTKYDHDKRKDQIMVKQFYLQLSSSY